MSVLIETSVGNIVVDLFTDKCPVTAKNFLKLCKIKYYNGCLFFNVQVSKLHELRKADSNLLHVRITLWYKVEIQLVLEEVVHQFMGKSDAL